MYDTVTVVAVYIYKSNFIKNNKGCKAFIIDGIKNKLYYVKVT